MRPGSRLPAAACTLQDSEARQGVRRSLVLVSLGRASIISRSSGGFDFVGFAFRVTEGDSLSVALPRLGSVQRPRDDIDVGSASGGVSGAGGILFSEHAAVVTEAAPLGAVLVFEPNAVFMVEPVLVPEPSRV